MMFTIFGLLFANKLKIILILPVLATLSVLL